MTYTFQATDFWDSRVPTLQGGGYYDHSPAARIIFDTKARLLTLSVNSTSYSDVIDCACIGIRVNGADYLHLSPNADGAYTFSLLLPRGQKRVEIVGSSADRPSTTVLQTFLVSMDCDQPFSIAQPQTNARLVIYGDSISVGANADSQNLHGWAGLLRRIYPGSVTLEAHGYRRLNEDAATSGARTTFSALLAGLSPSKLLIAIGTNDFNLSTGYWSAANFGIAYADLLDKFHALLPSVPVFCISPTPKSSETANQFGSTLPDFRSQISTICGARIWTTYLDGSAVLSISDIDASGVHPTTAGHAKYYAAIRTALGV